MGITMPDIDCRLAKLEERVETIQESMIERRRQSDHILAILEEIQGSISKMHGFGAGVAGAFGMIGAIAGLLWDRLIK